MIYRISLLFFASFTLLTNLTAQDCPRAEDPVTLISPTMVGNGSPGSCTQSALQTAITAGGHIQCNCGTNAVLNITTPLMITADVVIDGGGLTLNGNHTSRIIQKDVAVDLTVQHMRFINGRAPNTGSTFTDCGGAILARGNEAILKVIQCTFEDNSTTRLNADDIAGGAVYVFGQDKGIFSDCVFRNNQSSNGGAIGGLGSGIIIANCLFENNAAQGSSDGLKGHGGAINLDGVEIAASERIYSVCGSQFIGNNGYAQGGASNTVFSNNMSAQLEIDQCLFQNNYLRAADAGNGGAIFHVVDDVFTSVTEQQFTVTRSSFLGNQCNRQGGGIWAIVASQATVENCTFYENRTEHAVHGLGGGMAIGTSNGSPGASYLIRNNTFAENYAGLWAGGVFANSSATVTWQNNILRSNYNSNEGNSIWLDVNVNREMDIDLGGNMQWPPVNLNNFGETLATPSSTFTDTDLIYPPAQYGGPTPVLALACGSAALSAGSGCPTTDQRLVNRSGSCDLGAFKGIGTSDPLQESVTGTISMDETYTAQNTINANAQINGGVQLFLMACGYTQLNPGFEVQPNGQLEIW